jgi:biopolymer transport protein ExbD
LEEVDLPTGEGRPADDAPAGTHVEFSKPLVIRLQSDTTGQWTGLEIGNESMPPSIPVLEKGLQEQIAGPPLAAHVRIEAGGQMRYETVLRALEAVRRFGVAHIEFAQLPISRDAAPSPATPPLNRRAKITDQQRRAIDSIKRYGNVEADSDQPPDSIGSIVGVNLGGSRAVDADLESLKHMPFLRSIELSLTRVTSRGIEHIADLTDLEELYLGGTQVTDYGVGLLKRLPKLRVLFLGGTQVTDKSVQHLKEMASLAEVDLQNTKISAESIQELAAARPELKIHGGARKPNQ